MVRKVAIYDDPQVSMFVMVMCIHDPESESSEEREYSYLTTVVVDGHKRQQYSHDQDEAEKIAQQLLAVLMNKRALAGGIANV
jgi:hypothetical protein